MPTATRIAGFTVAVPNLDSAVAIYSEHLGYQVSWRDRAGALSQLWQAAELEKAHCAQLLPPDQVSGFVRLVEIGPVSDFVPFRYPGWNAAEVVVGDVDALAVSLADSPFRILGPPADLSMTSNIRAMQVEGPGGELLYLTQIKAPVPGFDLPMRDSGVGHCFVGIVSGVDGEALKAWYREYFGLPDAPFVDARVQGLSLAFDLPRDHFHPIAALALAPEFLIEIDQMPAADPRPLVAGVPAGIVSISIGVDTLPDSEHIIDLPTGDRAVRVVGAGGEWIELTKEAS